MAGINTETHWRPQLRNPASKDIQTVSSVAMKSCTFKQALRTISVAMLHNWKRKIFLLSFIIVLFSPCLFLYLCMIYASLFFSTYRAATLCHFSVIFLSYRQNVTQFLQRMSCSSCGHKPLLVVTLWALLVRMECLVLETWQHRVVGGVASAPRGAPPPRPSLFFFLVFPGLIPSQCHAPVSQTTASPWAATDFNWMKDIYCLCFTYLEECNQTNRMMMTMMTIIRNTL
jgi:hypothetical protein